MTTTTQSFRPSSDEARDLTAAVVLAILGAVGFRTSFAGGAYLKVAVVGALVGGLVAFLVLRLRLPLLVGAAASVVGFFLLAGPVTGIGVVPTPDVLSSLVDGAVNGWASLLSTLPPTEGVGYLLVVPFLCAYAGSLLAFVLASKVSSWPACIIPLAVVLCLSVLLGTREPASLLLQGGVFTAVTFAWLSLREQRRHRVVVATSRSGRRIGAGILLVGASAGALVLGPLLPLAKANDRVVLRDYVEPPLDLRKYPSPLASYRRFVEKASEDKVQLVASGLVPRQSIRLAVMDDYDGTVWSVSPPGVESSGSYRRVGEKIPLPDEPTTGRRRTTLDIKGLSGVWVPVPGPVTSARFAGARAPAIRDSFRYNVSAQAAAAPSELQAGDRLDLVTAVRAQPGQDALLRAELDEAFTRPLPPGVPPEIKATADKVIGGESSPFAKVKKLEEWFQKGYYSDGGPGSGVPPGHSLFRLVNFLGQEPLVGNAEQYVAAMALMLDSLDMPTRVVMGFRPDVQGSKPVPVLSKNVDAWVEVAFRDVGWVGFAPTPDRSRTFEQQKVPQPTRPQVVPEDTPPTTLPKTDPAMLDKPASDKDKNRDQKGDGNGLLRWILRWAKVIGIYVGLPVGVLVGAGLLIAGLKLRRRNKRRRDGPPATRIAGGWLEVVDVARDLGTPVPSRATRKESALFVPIDDGQHLASAADAAVFGETDPSEEEAAAFWQQVDLALESTLSPLSRPARVKAAVSLTSLRSRS